MYHNNPGTESQALVTLSMRVGVAKKKKVFMTLAKYGKEDLLKGGPLR